MESKTLLLASVIAYTVAVVVVGLWKSRETTGTGEDYYLAGRGLGAWLAALSGAASGESGWVLLGLVGLGYTGGISAAWLIPGQVAGYGFIWFVLGPALRCASLDTGALTIPAVLANRHPDQARTIRVVGAAIIVAFVTAYVAAQFNAVGKALNAMFAWPYHVGVVAGLAIVFAYVITGGFRASVWTDFVQALFMIAALLAMPVVGALTFEGDLIATIGQADAAMFDMSGGKAGFALVGLILGLAGVGLGNPGQPHVLVRLMATRDDAELRRGGAIATTWMVLVYIGAIATGMVARAWLPELADAEQALPAIATTLLPDVVAGFVLAAVLAAICSTADSQLLVASSSISTDLMQTSAAGRSYAHRTVIVVLGVLAALLAATENRVIFDFVLYAWAALGAGFGPALIGSLLWPGTSGKGVLAGMIGGVATAVIWKNVPVLATNLYELVPAFAVGLVLVRFVGRERT